MSDQVQPPWITAGLQDLGFHETGDNQGIQSFIAQAQCGHLGDPWCAIWANAKLEQSGIRGTRSAATIRISSNSMGRCSVPLQCTGAGRQTLASGMSGFTWARRQPRY